MSKFNWNRFYDELDSEEQFGFPYHIWVVNVLIELVSSIVKSAVVGLIMAYVGLTALSIIGRHYPDTTYNVIKSVMCDNNEYK